MNKQITVSLAALVLGTALVSAPAFAQKAANDGGLIAEPSGSAARQASERAPATPPTGRRLYNLAPNSVPQQPTPTRPPGAKPANDGGPM
jgi:uncharacterized membrane protein